MWSVRQIVAARGRFTAGKESDTWGWVRRVFFDATGGGQRREDAERAHGRTGSRSSRRFGTATRSYHGSLVALVRADLLDLHLHLLEVRGIVHERLALGDEIFARRAHHGGGAGDGVRVEERARVRAAREESDARGEEEGAGVGAHGAKSSGARWRMCTARAPRPNLERAVEETRGC